jgi:uncharacterized protein
MQFKRNLEADLLQWRDAPGRKPLLLKGARQVGKTSLLKSFGQQAFKRVVYFNFDEQPELKQFFEHTKDVRRILQNLSLLAGGTIVPDDTLLIFDEIHFSAVR